MAGFRSLARCASLAASCCWLLAATEAFAQASASDKAAAEALFDQGVQLMKQNSFAEACPKLEESQRADPAVGTLLYLGECYERSGKTASAWATFREAASSASNTGQTERARVAAKRAKDLEPTLSRLTVELGPDVAKIAGVAVKRGSQRLEPSLFGVPLPVDPGEYRIEVSAPGYEVWSSQINVGAAGAIANVRVPVLVKSAEAATAAPVGGAAPAPGAAPGSSQAPLSSASAVGPPPGGLTQQQKVGLVVGGVGLVGLGLGSIFGVSAISRNSDAESHCPRGALCDDQAGVDLTEDAQRSATRANIALGAGVVLLATGSVLYLTGGRRERAALAVVPILVPGTAAASLRGSF